MKKSISILLALIMIMSSLTIGVFAEADQAGQTGNDPAATEVQGEEGSTDVVNNEDSDKIDQAGDEAIQEDGQEQPGEESGEPAEDVTVETAGYAGHVAVDVNDGAIKLTGLSDGSYSVVYIKDGAEVRTETVAVSGGVGVVPDPAEIGTYAFKANGSDVTGTVAITPALGVATYSSYRGVALEWDPMGADARYFVYRDGGLRGTVTDGNRSIFRPGRIAFEDGEISDDVYAGDVGYGVVGVTPTSKSQLASVADSAVKQMYIRLTFKQKKKLKSHDGRKKKYTFQKGTTVYATGYIKGFYYFHYNIDGQTYYFRGSYMRFKNKSAMYTTAFNYSQEEAEYFVNRSGQASNTGYLIWANLFTQHIYIFNNINGLWRINTTLGYKGAVYQDWEISSGTASSPSPWGMTLTYKKKQTNIYKRQVVFPGHGKRYWNFYHSQSALHGPVSKGYGKPHSHGCIRNPKSNALFIYYSIPKKTRVLVY